MSDAPPSSQNSAPTTLLSPQTSEQVDGEFSSPPKQLHPRTLPLHRELHLSVFEVPPSSHISGAMTQLSPQIGLQFEGLVELPPVQFQPVTFPVQRALHFEVGSVF